MALRQRAQRVDQRCLQFVIQRAGFGQFQQGSSDVSIRTAANGQRLQVSLGQVEVCIVREVNDFCYSTVSDYGLNAAENIEDRRLWTTKSEIWVEKIRFDGFFGSDLLNMAENLI